MIDHQFATDPNMIASQHPASLLSDAFFGRLLNFYQRQNDNDAVKSEIWRGVECGMAAFAEVLKSNNPGRLRDALGNLYVKHAICGVDDPSQNTADGWKARLLMAAYSAGVVPVPMSEQPDPITDLDIETAVRGIEEMIRCPLTHPGGGGIRGAQVDDRFIPNKLLEAVPIWLASVGAGYGSDATVLEIGGGFGFAAYLFCHQRSDTDYHLVDLPKMAVIQAFFLALAFGESAIIFDDDTLPIGGLRIFVHGLILPSNRMFSLVLNQNSLPEMPEPCVHGYLDFIGRNLLPGGLFISINHESRRGGQVWLHKCAKEHPRLELIVRSLDWSGRGYVLEIYRKR